MKQKNGWYVIYVKSQQEGRVFNSLLDAGLEAFLPKTTVFRKWSDRMKKLRVPLFPSYVFVQIQSKVDFYKVQNVDGVAAFIKFGDEYAIVQEKDIERIKFLVTSDGIKDIEINQRLPKIGERMKISHGALSGLECEILKVNNTHKIIVRIAALRQSVMATIPLNYLRCLKEVA